MDIEGGEDYAWEGAIETLKKNDVTIALEIHNGINVEFLVDLFIDIGYSVEADGAGEVANHIPILPSRHLSNSEISDKSRTCLTSSRNSNISDKELRKHQSDGKGSIFGH